MNAPTATVYAGDCRPGLYALPAEHLHCVVTSVPYFGQRFYGTEPQIWGGDPTCAHHWHPLRVPRPNGAGGSRALRRHRKGGAAHQTAVPPEDRATYSDQCAYCAAWRGELGSEPTVELFVAHIVEVFRAVRHALRSDGTVWLNIGDGYSADSKWGGRSGVKNTGAAIGGLHRGRCLTGLGDKQLLLMPARLALALQADGWILRNEIIWVKPAALPESAQDRLTKVHEQIFLLTKQTHYYFDAWAIREPATGNAHSRGQGRNPKTREAVAGEVRANARWAASTPNVLDDRHPRDVWTIAAEKYPEAHFAVFPSEIPRRAILAGTSAHGCCAGCGAPWTRVLIRVPVTPSAYQGKRFTDGKLGAVRDNTGTRPRWARQATGAWQPGCGCNAAVVPCRVADPFLGSGTTVAVALRLGRDGWGSELQPNYLPFIQQRITAARAALASATPWYANTPRPVPENADYGPLFAGIAQEVA